MSEQFPMLHATKTTIQHATKTLEKCNNISFEPK